jgi:ABC-type Fe3+-hydroxamate transport system substrate-binding protein
MGYRLALIGAIFLVFAGSRVAEERIERPVRREVAPRWHCRRIVSLAPSITEVLYALDLADRVVGCGKGDRHLLPERPFGCFAQKVPVPFSALGQTFLSAREIADIAADRNACPTPSVEAILWLKPDLVIMLEEQAGVQPVFGRLKIETLVVSHRTAENVADSFRTIGRVCGKGMEGRRMGRE